MASLAPGTVVTICLRQDVTIGGIAYPIYVGFMAPGEILRVAIAPAFATTERQELIATDIMKPSARNWQRPLETKHWRAIAETFNSRHDIMPNAVLLSTNASYGYGVSIAPLVAGGNTLPATTITLDPTGGHPLWIIDGQHRIKGLANSILASQKIPVVLLIDDPHNNVYGGATLAKIFAQVTTQATALQPLHNDWLKFSFRLGQYAKDDQERKAMEAVAKLASTPTFVDESGYRANNPFFDRIQFNDYLNVTGFHGIPYTCTELKELVFRYYYNMSQVAHGELSSDEIAKQLALAYNALIATSKVPHDKHCILAMDKHGAKVKYAETVMRNGFIAACLRRIATKGVPASWHDLFVKLQFQSADWDFTWRLQLSGRDNTRSFTIANNIFFELFNAEALPPGLSSVELYFQGNNAEIKLETSKPTPTGRYSSRAPAVEHSLNLNQAINKFRINSEQFLRLKYTSPNVQVDFVEDLDSPRSDPIRYARLTKAATNQGLLIEASRKSPLKLAFKIVQFGGITKTCEVNVAW